MISTQDWLAEGGRTLLPVEIPRIDILQNTDNVDLVVLYPDGRPDPENRDTDKPNPAAWEGYLQESEDASLAQRIPAELRLAGNPDSIARYLHQNFTYETDQSQFGIEDYWQTPQEFLLSRKGDCEDFAVFSHTILKMNGRKSFVLAIVSPLDAHTVTIFKEDEKFDALDVARVRRFGTLTIRGLIPKLSPYWKYGAIVAMSYSTHSPRIVKKIES
ncbi:MAG: transglutaminase-like cysteine peptidase [Candidatus Omnitrophota bacterium]|nr:transglutaminase-like cysteine peptidase [Candidatus Omnitrophota bacterium]